MEIPADKINTPLNITYSYSIQFEVSIKYPFPPLISCVKIFYFIIDVYLHCYLLNDFNINIQMYCLNHNYSFFSKD